MKNNNNLIRKIAIFAVLTISILGKSFGQIVFFIDMKKGKLTSYLSTRPEPTRDRGCALRIIILNEQGNKDTLDIPGCSRYEVNINEYGTVLTTYSWPFYYYSTDCALEDYIVPSNDDAELIMQFFFKRRSISANVKWNIQNIQYYREKKKESSELGRPMAMSSYLDEIANMLSKGKSMQEILDFFESEKNTINAIIEPEQRIYYIYDYDILTTFLPMNNRTFSPSEFHALVDSIKGFNAKYSPRW
jgi:hypothetical protein